MEPEEIERVLLSSIKAPEHISILKSKYKINQSHFPYYRKVAEFVFKHVVDYGKGPDEVTLNVVDSTFIYSPTNDFSWIAEIYSIENDRRNVTILLYEYGQKLKNGSDPINIVKQLSNQLQYLNKVEMDNRNILETNVDERLTAHVERASKSTTDRIKFGIEPLDNKIDFYKGMLVAIMAKEKVGKSWISLRIAASAYMQGFKVAVLSPEFTASQLRMRSEVILAQVMGFPLSYRALSRGDETIIPQYEEFLKTLNRQDWLIYDASLSVRVTAGDVKNIITRDSPDVIVVDGIYLMDDEEQSKESWQQIRNISKSLKLLATGTNTAIIVTNQARRKSNDAYKKNGNDTAHHADEAALGVDLGRFCDIFITVGEAGDDINARTIAAPLVRSGESMPDPKTICFNPDTGYIGGFIGTLPAIDFDELVG